MADLIVSGGTVITMEEGRRVIPDGAVAVSGTGSALTVDAGTQIGNAGTGSLSVLDGGHASLGLAGDYSEILLGLGHYGWVADSDKLASLMTRS